MISPTYLIRQFEKDKNIIDEHIQKNEINTYLADNLKIDLDFAIEALKELIFTTNQYKVLEVMYKNILSIADKECCPLGQGEIADELGLSRAVVNKIFTELKEAGYISMVTRDK